jgi:hypothetical protein
MNILGRVCVNKGSVHFQYQFLCVNRLFVFVKEKFFAKLAFSMTRPSCGDPSSVQVCNTVWQRMECLLLPLRSPMVGFAVSQQKMPGRRAKAGCVFAFGPFVHSMQYVRVQKTLQLNHPFHDAPLTTYKYTVHPTPSHPSTHTLSPKASLTSRYGGPFVAPS